MENQATLFEEPKKEKPAKKPRQKKDGSLYKNWGGFFPHPLLDPPYDAGKAQASVADGEDQAGDMPGPDAGLPQQEP
jgi:hypothetical protein